ncbi:hypothetical protein CK489_04070 [Bradyrhizobium sp. UFLA03-84]|uniref:energy transducer TonB family protein n=1 Tax=Bradyrhizobium sp. UFLA03-84 TaxID=418599 RepID=UPI000BAE4998|nr:energy transducer TonB [Bradyrhizobium sp. UFLA03-84]PAY09757.1 hypothetical protein CK489_04070 [Bradyrhizobium sp. UFLA03-84]
MLPWLVVCIALLFAATAPALAKNSAAPKLSPSAAAWRQDFSNRVLQARRSPPLASGQRGTAKVGFRIDRAGHLMSSWLVEATGIPAIDAEALAIVERAQPFPPFPADTAGEDFQFILPITFDPVAPWDSPALKAKLNSVCRGC